MKKTLLVLSLFVCLSLHGQALFRQLQTERREDGQLTTGLPWTKTRTTRTETISEFHAAITSRGPRQPLTRRLRGLVRLHQPRSISLSNKFSNKEKNDEGKNHSMA